MVTRKTALEDIKAVGFIVEHEEDMAQRPDATPWYTPLVGNVKSVYNCGDFFTGLRLSMVGRCVIGSLLRILEAVRMAPPGTALTAHELSLGADSLVSIKSCKFYLDEEHKDPIHFRSIECIYWQYHYVYACEH